MPTRAEILDTLATSQATVTSFFQGLSLDDLVRPCTASGVPGAAAWRAKDHYAHQAQNERNVLMLLRLIQSGATEMPGFPSAVNAEERAAAANQRNQTYVDAHHDDPMESLAADIVAARQETLQLLEQFTNEQLAAPASLAVVAGRTGGEMFTANAQHPAIHIAWIKEGLRRGTEA